MQWYESIFDRDVNLSIYITYKHKIDFIYFLFEENDFLFSNIFTFYSNFNSDFQKYLCFFKNFNLKLIL